MAGYKERKLEILEYVSERGEVTASDVADDLNLEIHNARTLLKKHHSQWLLIRQKSDDAWGTREYNIAEIDLDRIEWIKESPEELECEGDDK